MIQDLDLIKDNAPWAFPMGVKFLKKLNKSTGFIITRDTLERKAECVFIEDIKKSAYDPLTKAALISNADKIIREYQNQKNIVEIAIPLLTESAKPENIDDDWLFAFMDKARMISNKDFQIIWGRILAEECKEPGKISKQLLVILSQMDRQDANAFTTLCKFCVKFNTSQGVIEGQPIIVMDKIDSYYNKYSLSLGALRNLNAFGLIDLEESLASLFMTFPGTIVYSAEYGEKRFVMPDNCTRLKLGGVIFKKTGMQLFSMVDVSLQDGFWEEIAVPFFKKRLY